MAGKGNSCPFEGSSAFQGHLSPRFWKLTDNCGIKKVYSISEDLLKCVALNLFMQHAVIALGQRTAEKQVGGEQRSHQGPAWKGRGLSSWLPVWQQADSGDTLLAGAVGSLAELQQARGLTPAGCWVSLQICFVRAYDGPWLWGKCSTE